MFWLYRYKGFSRTAARTVHTAVVLAGQQGWRWCKLLEARRRIFCAASV